MQTEGIELIFGVKGLKVHSKMCVIERIEGGKVKDMALYQLEILMKLLQRYILMSHYLQAISKF
jgi:hypothetical protein